MHTTASRYHDICCGHRVVGHESKCAHLHGHNYRIHFSVDAIRLDTIGRVIDFSVINSRLCQWLETNWDHRFLMWEKDPVMQEVSRHLHTSRVLAGVNSGSIGEEDDWQKASLSFVTVDFNPTAENMAAHLIEVVGPAQLKGTGARLIGVRIEETRKCSAEVWL